MKRSSSAGNVRHHPKQEKIVKQSSLRVNSLQPGELYKVSKPERQREEPKLRHTEDPPKASLLTTILRRALHQPSKLGEQEPENTGEDSLIEGRSQSKRVAPFRQGEGGNISNDVGRAFRVNERSLNASLKSLLKNGAGSIRDGPAKSVSDLEDVRELHNIDPSHDQQVSRRNLLSISTSGLIKKEREPLSRFSKMEGPEFDSAEGSAEQGSGGPESGSGAIGRGDVGDNRGDEDLDEDRAEKSEYLIASPFFR